MDEALIQRRTRHAVEWLVGQDWAEAVQAWTPFAQRAELVPEACAGPTLVYPVGLGLQLEVQLSDRSLAMASIALAGSVEMFGWEEAAYEAVLDEYEGAFHSVVSVAESVLGGADDIGDPDADGFPCECGAMRAAVWRRTGSTIELVMETCDDQGPVSLAVVVWPSAAAARTTREPRR